MLWCVLNDRHWSPGVAQQVSAAVVQAIRSSAGSRHYSRAWLTRRADVTRPPKSEQPIKMNVIRAGSFHGEAEAVQLKGVADAKQFADAPVTVGEKEEMTDSANSAQNEIPILPAHVEDTLQAVDRFRSMHEADAGPLQRLIERTTRRAGSPAFIALLTACVVGWIAFNLGLIASGRDPIDKPPFFWLQGAVALTALYMTVFILTTQRRDDKLAGMRDDVTLELSILSEQKSAKIIELLEELRRDDPHISDRQDDHADALSKPADPHAVLDALKHNQETSL